MDVNIKLEMRRVCWKWHYDVARMNLSESARYVCWCILLGFSLGLLVDPSCCTTAASAVNQCSPIIVHSPE